MLARNLFHHAYGLLLTLLLGGLAAATLVRLAPGYGIDEREFDIRLSESSLESIRASRAAEHNLVMFYASYLGGLIHGNFGISHSLRRPVAELIKERGPVTLRLASVGLLGGWTLGLALALAAAQWKRTPLDLLSVSFCGLVLCLPAAVLGLLVLFTGAPRWWAIALVVFPKVFSYSRGLLDKASRAPHVLLARAKGLTKSRILLWHIVPSMLPETLALAGVSVSLAFSAVIPLEAVCDLPGVGQLAWQAALGRDVPLLVTVTLLLALITRVANAAADVAIAALPRC
jgi:peptide/nickel transport system permease protein